MGLREERDRALFAAYNKALAEHSFRCQSEAINFVRTSAAPKFYISSEFCAIIIGRLLRGENPGLKGRQRLRKFEVLFRLFLAESGKPENKSRSTREICALIVDMPAPEFYLNYRMTSGIINKQKEKWLYALLHQIPY